MRLFIGVELPEEIKERIHQTARELSKRIDPNAVRMVEKENYHITLRFLGEVDEKDLGKLNSALQKALREKGRFKVSLKGIGVFPDENYIRVVWVGVNDGAEELEEIARGINKSLREIGFKGDERFSAHITIARVKRKIKISKFLREKKDEEFGEFVVGRVVLFESKLLPGKSPEYSKVFAIDLK